MSTCGAPGVRTLGSSLLNSKEIAKRILLHPLLPLFVVIRDASEDLPVNPFWIVYILLMAFSAIVLHVLLRGRWPFCRLPSLIYACVLYVVFSSIETLAIASLYGLAIH